MNSQLTRARFGGRCLSHRLSKRTKSLELKTRGTYWVLPMTVVGNFGIFSVLVTGTNSLHFSLFFSSLSILWEETIKKKYLIYDWWVPFRTDPFSPLWLPIVCLPRSYLSLLHALHLPLSFYFCILLSLT